MATVEVPTHVCHILDTHYCGDTATIGHDCDSTPLWDPLVCVPIDAGLVLCTPESLTLSAAAAVSLPLAPSYDEAP